MEATFYVIADGTNNLLGKNTAIAIKVFKIGVNINSIKSFPISKFKDVVIETPIDESAKPVSQPYRQIPLPLEAKVDKKTERAVRLRHYRRGKRVF